jgi:hypothetical protein
MITLHQCDGRWIFQHEIEVDEFGPIPANVVTVAPPSVNSPKVAQWTGSAWAVLNSAPAIPGTSLQTALDRISDRRKIAVDSGATYNGNVYDSSPGGQHAIASVIVFAKEYEAVAGAGTFSAQWSSLTGFVTLNLHQVVQLGFVVGAHVQACFARQMDLTAQAEGGDIEGAMAALETGWP